MVTPNIPYRESPPNRKLADIIVCFWRLEMPDGVLTEPEPILPDGNTEMIFNLADPFIHHHNNGDAEIQSKTLVIGQMKKNTTVQPTGKVSLFGIRFQAGGLFPILQFPLSELTDKILDSKLILGQFTHDLEEQLQACSTFYERIRIAETALSQIIQNTHRSNPVINELVRRITETGGRVSVEKLSQNIGLSHRQIERGFRKCVGITPKTLARVIRFQTIFAALDIPSPNWSQIALGCGYYDQAHLIHDFKTFSGLSPIAFINRQLELATFFMRKDKTSFFYNTGK